MPPACFSVCWRDCYTFSDMYNDLFSIGPLTVHGYGLSIGVGTVLALLLAWHRAEKRGIPSESVTGLAALVLILGFAGAKLLYILTSIPEFLSDPWGVLGSEGFVVYGGLLLGLAAALWWCHRKAQDPLLWTDLLLPSVALAQGFGRIGCFLAGCCYGLPTASRLGVVFPVESAAPAGVPLWPVQLFSSAGDFLLAAVLLLTEKKAPRRGRTTALYLALYGIGRFLIEFLRNDERGTVGIFSTSQFLSFFFLAGAAAVLLYRKKQKRNGI